jgi:hypothetical protein
MDPVGPLPTSVYWRRRLLAVGAALLGLFGLLWLVTALLLPPGVDSDDSTTGRTAHVESSPPAAGTAPAADVRPPDPGATGAPAGAPPAGPSAGPAAPNAGPADEAVRPDPAAGPPVLVPPAGPAPATGPPPCPDGQIKVTAEVGAPQYPQGAKPVLRIVVANSGPTPCVRDLDGAEQEIVVWSGDGAKRLWSSNDCVNPSSSDLRTLVPGQPVAFAVNWSGLGSVPGCTAERDRIGPGAYRVVTRLGPVVSAPVPLLIT